MKECTIITSGIVAVIIAGIILVAVGTTNTNKYYYSTMQICIEKGGQWFPTSGYNAVCAAR